MPRAKGQKTKYFSIGSKKKDKISQAEFNRIDTLSKKAIKKFEKIISRYTDKTIRDGKFLGLVNIDKYTRRFGGWDEAWRDFKTIKGINQYKRQLEYFLQDDWENNMLERFKSNFEKGIESLFGEDNRKWALMKELDEIDDLQELSYIYYKSTGRVSIQFFYERSVDSAEKAYRSLLYYVRKYKKEYRKHLR